MNNGPPVVARAYPELTWVALVTGWFIGAIIAVAIGYAALILGFSIEGSELAAILGFGVLRGGTWGTDAALVRGAFRHNRERDDRGHGLGLRLARSVVPPPTSSIRRTPPRSTRFASPRAGPSEPACWLSE